MLSIVGGIKRVVIVEMKTERNKADYACALPAGDGAKFQEGNKMKKQKNSSHTVSAQAPQKRKIPILIPGTRLQGIEKLGAHTHHLTSLLVKFIAVLPVLVN